MFDAKADGTDEATHQLRSVEYPSSRHGQSVREGAKVERLSELLKTRTVLPLDSERVGHRLGVNGLAVDAERSILYTGGRDGVVNAWNLSPNHSTLPAPSDAGVRDSSKSRSISRQGKNGTLHWQQTQAHTNWINDLSLIQANSALVTASSDLSVKVWRPHADDILPPQTIGLHTDYIKRVASPSSNSGHIITGGLDRKVFVWDLNGGGRTMQIDVASENAREKGSIYALAANESIIATGGPESVVKLWDTRTGQRIVNFVGHTDIIRDILISHDNDRIMTACSDRTIKIWSLTAGRCMQTLGMHADSVWCLMSDHPQLAIFYSGDRSGFVAKTDLRATQDLEEGVSIAVCQEQEGIIRIARENDRIWAATANSSFNCWHDADLSTGVEVPESVRSYHWNNGSAKARSPPSSLPAKETSPTDDGNKRLPFNCLLRITPNAGYLFGRASTTVRKNSIAMLTSESGGFAPLRNLPMETMEGQNGLIGHVQLNDRQRVLTLDTTGNVTLWHMLECKPIQSFGKRDMTELAAELNTLNVTVHWCQVDTRTGTVTCTIDEKHGFDAEIYADESEYAKDTEFREDLRFNLGRWILRYLFSAFLEEEIRRDGGLRKSFEADGVQSQQNIAREKPRFALDLPPPPVPFDAQNFAATSRAQPGGRYPMTPGLAIGLATPGGGGPLSPALTNNTSSSAAGVDTDEGSRASTEAGSDYFSQKSPTSQPATGTSSNDASQESKVPKTPSENVEDKNTLSPPDSVKTPGGSSTRFGKRFLTTLNKSGKRLVYRSDKPADAKQAAETVSKADDSSETPSNQVFNHDGPDPTSYKEVLQRMRAVYAGTAGKAGAIEGPAESLIQPTLPTELPILTPPPGTTVIIHEDRSDSAGVTDVFEGKVENLGFQADLIESVGPVWLADVLLYNRTPEKAPTDVTRLKLTFVIEPYKDQLPHVCRLDGSERLNANRLLRVRKIAGYIADKLEPPKEGADADPEALKPEQYLELLCNGQVLPPKTTLAWVRSQVWKGTSDMIIQYRANGRKPIEPTGPELYWPNGRPVIGPFTIPGQVGYVPSVGASVDGENKRSSKAL